MFYFTARVKVFWRGFFAPQKRPGRKGRASLRVTNRTTAGKGAEVADGLAGEIDEHVAGFQAGFCGGRAGLDIAEAHAVFRLAKIRNRAEPRAIAATAARAGDAAVGILGGDGDEFGALGGGIELRNDAGDEVEQPRRVWGVDLVPGVGGLVIIGMQSG